MAVPESSRQPYSLPRIHGDDEYAGRKESETLCYPVPIHLAQRQKYWNRMSGQHTLSSARRSAYHFDPCAVKDSLDFAVKSTYDHHRQLFRSKAEVTVQPGRCEMERVHVFTNRVKALPEKKMPLSHPLIVTGQLKKEDVNSFKTTLGSVGFTITLFVIPTGCKLGFVTQLGETAGYNRVYQLVATIVVHPDLDTASNNQLVAYTCPSQAV